MAATAPNGGQVYWIDGLPYSAIRKSTSDSGGLAAWQDGLPVAGFIATSTVAAALAASVNTAATISAAFTTSITPAASVNAAATISAAFTTAVTFAASVSAAATISAPLTTVIPVAASVSAAATISAAFTTAIGLAVSVSAAATVSAAFTTAIGFAAGVTGTATVSASFVTAIRFAALAAGVASVVAALRDTGGLSDYLENHLIDHVFRNRAYTMPTTIYVGLYTATPSDAGGGTEVTGGSYARVLIGPSDTAWQSTQGTATAVASSGTDGETVNASVVTFPAPTADWGTVTYVGLFDAVTGGHLLFWAGMSLPKVINNGDAAFTFAATNLTVTFR